MKLSDYKQAFYFYLSQIKKYKYSLLVVIILILIAEGLATGMRYLFKLFIDAGQEYIDGSLLAEGLYDKIFFFSTLAVIGIIIYYLTYWFRFHFGNKVLTSSSKEAKLNILAHLFTLDYKFFSDTKSGSLITKFNRIERSMQSITESFFLSITPAIVQLIISITALFVLHYSYAILVILALIISACYNIWLQKRQLFAQEKVNEAEELETALIADTFSNVETVKLYAKEEYVQSRFYEKAENTRYRKLIWENYFRWFDSFNNSLPMVFLTMILILSGMLLVNNEVTLGDIFFVESTFITLVGFLRYVLWMFRSMYTSLVDLDSISRYLERKPEIKDKKSAKELRVKQGKVSFNNISFSYNKTSEAISNASITIPAKQSVAFVGKSGSGKSTLVKLLCRFYDVKSGNITIDDQDISQVTQKSLRESLAFVAQEGILFDDTIYNNILFPNPQASKKDVFAAIKAAQLDDVINKLPKKEHTLVGERGVKLSGGERQRVSVARAILANRPIVILDEATSALDSITEQKIQTALKQLLKNKTSIIIAHRLSTIMHVDNIVVCGNGKILEQGTHKELIKKKGEYYNLWKMQKDGFIE